MVSKSNRTPKQDNPPKAHRRVRVVCISDTHELHRDLALPDGDLLIHAGDFTFWNHVSKIRDFNDWLGELPHRHKVVIPGNHDRAFHNDRRFREIDVYKRQDRVIAVIRVETQPAKLLFDLEHME